MTKEEPMRHVSSPDHVLSYFKLEKRSLLIVTVSGILYNAGMLSGLWFEGQLAQYLYDLIGGSKTFRDMLILAVCYVIATALVQLMRYIKRFYVRRFANNVSRNMKHILYFNLVHRSKSELERSGMGSMMTRAILDVDACVEGMRKFTTEVFDTGVALVCYVIMLFVYDWRLALISCIFPPFAYLMAEKMKTVVQFWSARNKESAERLNAATLDRVSGALTYRVYGCEAQRDQSYEKDLKDYESTGIRANIWTASMPPIYQIVTMISVIFIIWFGEKNVRGVGWTNWNIAAFTTFLACFVKMGVKSSKAAKLFNAVQKAQVSWKRIKPLIHETVRETPEKRVAPSDLFISNLNFAYPEGQKVLKDISFSVKVGQIIGVTGPVACGKSTLGKVFLREFPYNGSVQYGGIELREFPPEMGIVAYVGHQPELMSGTIAENVLLGKNADPSYWLKIVCMDQEIAAMPDGIETRIGSGGVRLSGGQQQRVALARALCSERPLMILDDPFSAVDKETEKMIFENLQKLKENHTILLISHRLSLFPELDGVFWMENGQGVFTSHNELMNSNTTYAGLYHAQTAAGGQNDA